MEPKISRRNKIKELDVNKELTVSPYKLLKKITTTLLGDQRCLLKKESGLRENYLIY